MTSSDPGPPIRPPGRGNVGLLTDRVFGAYFLGRLFSTGGVWIHNVVAAILAYEITGSTFMVGMISVAQFGPQLVFSPLSGSLADRFDRRSILLLGRLLIAFGSGALAVAVGYWGVDGMPGIWPLMAAALVVGLGFVVAAPAQNALIPALVYPAELAPAVALNAIPPTVARAVGPAVGAIVALTLGPMVAFGIAAGANLVFAAIVFYLPIVGRSAPPVGSDSRVRIGIRYVMQDRPTALILLGVLAVGFGADPVITLTPALSAAFGETTQYVGLFASVFGVGAGLGLLAVARLRSLVGAATSSSLGLWLLAGGILLAGIMPVLTAVLISFLIAGMGMGLSFASLSTQLQERIPEELRGRIMALWAVAYLGSRPIAGTSMGLVADIASTSTAFVCVAGLVAVVAWVCRPGQLSRSGMH